MINIEILDKVQAALLQAAYKYDEEYNDIDLAIRYRDLRNQLCEYIMTEAPNGHCYLHVTLQGERQ